MQKDQEDEEFLKIQNTFTNRTFKVFFNIVDIVSTFTDQKQLEDLLIERLRAGKSPELVQCVNRYAIFFIEELKHFLRIHGFVKSDLPKMALVSPATQWNKAKQEIIQQPAPKRKINHQSEAPTSNFGFGFPNSLPAPREEEEEESQEEDDGDEVGGSEQGEGEASVIKLIEKDYSKGSKFSKKRSRQQYQGNNYSNAQKNGGKKKKLNFK